MTSWMFVLVWIGPRFVLKIFLEATKIKGKNTHLNHKIRFPRRKNPNRWEKKKKREESLPSGRGCL